MYHAMQWKCYNEMLFRYNYVLSHVLTHYAQHGETLIVAGPDVLSSCGAPGRLLQLQEEYVVGIGGICNPIGEWSTVSSYSSSEINLLTRLASGCGAVTDATTNTLSTTSNPSSATTTNTPTITPTVDIPQRNMCIVLQQIASRAIGSFECSTNQRCDGINCTADPLKNGMLFQSRAVILVCQLPRPAVEIVLLDLNGATIVNETVDHSKVLSVQQSLQVTITLDQYQNAIGLQVNDPFFR